MPSASSFPYWDKECHSGLTLLWLDLFVAGENLNPIHIPQLPSTPPNWAGKRTVPVRPLNCAVGRLQLFSTTFEHLSAAFVNAQPFTLPNRTFCRQYSALPWECRLSLHLLLDSTASELLAVRPTVGKELCTLLGTTLGGLYNIPDVTQLSPHALGP